MIKPGFAFLLTAPRFLGRLSLPFLNKITCTHMLAKKLSKEVATLFRPASCGRTTEIAELFKQQPFYLSLSTQHNSCCTGENRSMRAIHIILKIKLCDRDNLPIQHLKRQIAWQYGPSSYVYMYTYKTLVW